MQNITCKFCPTHYLLFPIPSQRRKKGISVVKGRCFYEQIQNYEGFKLHSIVLTVCITIKVLCWTLLYPKKGQLFKK